MIKEFIEQNNLPSYRLDQFNNHFYAEAVNSFDEFTSWPKSLREKAKEELDFTSLDMEKEFISKKDGTIKAIFKRKLDGQRFETVLMRHKDGRNTVCVSCMVGCPVNCTFCATGKMGFKGKLKSEEIVDQILYFQRRLKPENQKVTNVVFMGMGEPMLNLEEVQDSIAKMTDQDKIGMSKRRITISTSGYIPQFKKLVKDGFRGRVAISLHAPNQELRAKLMPVAKMFKLSDLLETLDEYVDMTNKRVSYEYILIKGITDQDDHAYQLAELFSNRLAHINLIPYNPIRGVNYRRPSREQVERFSQLLTQKGVHNSIRVTMGDDVNAACGQLVDKENLKEKRDLSKYK